MAATGFTPISLYYTTTASAAPTAGNLVAGELAINTNDGVLYYKDSSGVVQSIASKAGNSGSFTNLAYTGTLTGGTGIVNLGSGQFYKTSGGLIGVGTSSPTNTLQVAGGISATGSSPAFQASAGIVDVSAGVVRINATGADNSTNGTMTFNTASANAGVFNERMRITSAGDVLIGSTSTRASAKLDIRGNVIALGENASFYGTIEYNAGAGLFTIAAENGGNITFKDGSTENMRIDASGNVLVGTTNSSASAGVGIKFAPTGNDATTPALYQVGSASTSGNNTYMLYSTGAGAYRFYVNYAGTIFATSIVISAISDERLKENIKDIDTGINTIMALKPRRFDWKDGKGQNKKNVAGFIAQEFETVFPECVGTAEAGADGIEYKNINHETLIPTLVKAIQEQQALIQNLTTRLTALESK